MSRRQLPSNQLPEDETSRHPHENMQTQDERRLSHLQTVDSIVLLSRQTLPRNKVSGAVLLQHQAQTQAAAAAAEAATGSAVAQADGRDEHEDGCAYERRRHAG